MINFDGALLVDISSMSGPPFGSDAADTPDGIDIYKHDLITDPDALSVVACEGCGYDPEGDAEPRRMYDTYALTPDSYDTCAPTLTYCQSCMEDIKRSYDEDPFNISAHGRFKGAPEWWQPMLLSGHANGVWREFEELVDVSKLRITRVEHAAGGKVLHEEADCPKDDTCPVWKDWHK